MSKNELSLQDIATFLKENPIQILSTSIENVPHSRPVGSASLINEKIYCCINKGKKMYKQLLQNPRVCLCVCGTDFAWLRLYGRVVFDESKAVKEEFIRLGKTRFKDTNDENFLAFYFDEIKAELHKGLDIKIFYKKQIGTDLLF